MVPSRAHFAQYLARVARTEKVRAAMASRSLFITLRRKCNVAGISRPFCSSSTALTESVFRDDSQEETDNLKTGILRVRLPKRSVTNVIQNWVHQGNQINVSELRQISKELRMSQRHKHALEVSEWMVSHNKSELLDSDYAVRIVLMTKVFGIDAAERYFEGLPPTAKTCETYTALLHCYAAAKWTEKAEELYERIKDSQLSLTALTYNEMMTMYMSVGQVEKVPLVVEELKRRKVTPDIFTYNVWISSCAAMLKMDQVRSILSEMRSDPGFTEGWERYINLANLYINIGHLVNAGSSSLVETEKGITQSEWITYDFLIILNAGLGNKGRIDQIWKSLLMTKQKMTSRNYTCIISSYIMLGHLKEVGDVIDQWKLSTTEDFVVSASTRILNAFRDIGLTESAHEFHTLLVQKNCDPSSSLE